MHTDDFERFAGSRREKKVREGKYNGIKQRKKIFFSIYISDYIFVSFFFLWTKFNNCVLLNRERWNLSVTPFLGFSEKISLVWCNSMTEVVELLAIWENLCVTMMSILQQLDNATKQRAHLKTPESKWICTTNSLNK